MIKLDPNETYRSLGVKLSVGETTIYKVFTHLKKLGIVRRKGGRAYGHWLLNENINKTEY